MADGNSGLGSEMTARDYASGQKVFARYTLKKVLGRGGMGVVWLARDEELEREVALKFLPDLVVLDKATLSELKRETRRSLELTHKNIVRIYDFVQSESSACISMEYIDGDTLSNLRAEKEQKVFQPEEIATWTAQLCDALDYAHNHARIIHRDLKPANLLVNQKGDLKISDFGIARSLGDSMSQLTMASGTSGTLVYMSPQQLDGERGSHLDDVYSLGATLYDLLTGKPPFYSGNVDKQVHERTAPSMTERRKEFNIEPARLPPVWEQTIAACLAKDPAKRPESAAEVARRLQLAAGTVAIAAPDRANTSHRLRFAALAAAALLVLAGGWFALRDRAVAPLPPPPGADTAVPARAKSIAVLPFESLSTEEGNAVLASGVHREVLSNLAKVAELKVISRMSVMRYKPGADRNVKEIGGQLEVAYLVEGTVQREGNTIRVTADLIDTGTDAQVWSETFDGDINDVLRFQSEIAQRISNQLGAKLSPLESTELASRPTQDIAAFESYIRARALMETPDSEEKYTEDYTRAVQLLEQAVARDRNFVAAYWALSEANIQLYRNSVPSNADYRTRAEAALKEAQRIAPEAGETLHAQARIIYYGYRDYTRALATLEEAAKSLPNSAEVTMTRGLLYRRFGRWQEAFAQFKRATELNPQDPFSYTTAEWTALGLRWWDEADQMYERMAKRLPKSPRGATIAHAVSLLVRGDVAAGNKQLESLKLQLPGDFDLLFYGPFLERDLEQCRRVLAEAAKDAEFQDFRWDKELQLAFVTKFPFDEQAAREAEKRLEERLAGSVSGEEQGRLIIAFSAVKMLLGKKEEALRMAEESVEQHPISEDSNNVTRLQHLAYMYLYAGENDRALQTFAKLVQLPHGVGYDELKDFPVLDGLRQHPRFEEILKQSQQPFPRL